MEFEIIQNYYEPNWTKPDYIDMRFGFEVTMYILNR